MLKKNHIIFGLSFLPTEQTSNRPEAAADKESRDTLKNKNKNKKVWQVVPRGLSDFGPNNPLLNDGKG